MKLWLKIRPLLIVAAFVFVAYILIQKVREMNYKTILKNVFASLGVRGDLIPLAIAQAMNESNSFKSHVFLVDNNCYGYTYAGQKNATQGTKSPDGGYYAHYVSIEDCATDVGGYLLRHESTFPINCTPLQYATALKSLGYFGSDTVAYAKRITEFLNAA